MDYKEYVTVDNIVIADNGKCRYLAEYGLKISENESCHVDKSKDKVAAVLLKNPSKADKEKSDQTINAVLDYMYQFKYSKVYIVNLIPVYATNSSVISEDCWSDKRILRENMGYIKKAIQNTDKLFVGWGGNFKPDAELMKEQIACVERYVSKVGKKMYCYTINKTNKQPRHPCRNGWKKGKKEVDFEIFYPPSA